MSRIDLMRMLLGLVGVVSVVKAAIFINIHAYDQLFLLVCTALWLTWIINSVFKKWNLPAPFAYNEGENQVARITYCITVLGLFLFVSAF